MAALRESTTSQVIVANDPSAHTWFPHEQIVGDEEPGVGPLAGIATALAVAEGSPILLLAWDMPFVPPGLLAELRRLGDSHPDASAVVPRHGGAIEPVSAWYAPSALTECRTLLASGERRAGALALGSRRTIWLEDRALAAFGNVERIFTSVDTAEKLEVLGGARP